MNIRSVLGCFLLWLPLAAGASLPEKMLLQCAGETLRYKVKYQGILSAYLPLEIATATLHLQPGAEAVEGVQLRHATLAVTTESFPSMEAVYPLRFNYGSWFDPGLTYTVVVDIQKRSSRSNHDLLWFNRKLGVVRSYRKEGTQQSGFAELPPLLRQVSHLQQYDGFRERQAQKLSGSNVLDRLAMLYALRNHPLIPGKFIELVVSNGKDLLGYRVTVEAKEILHLNAAAVATLRLLLTPRFGAGEDPGYAVHLWLSDDAQRLPLRFRSSKFGGSIELVLDSVDAGAG